MSSEFIAVDELKAILDSGKLAYNCSYLISKIGSYYHLGCEDGCCDEYFDTYEELTRCLEGIEFYQLADEIIIN